MSSTFTLETHARHHSYSQKAASQLYTTHKFFFFSSERKQKDVVNTVRYFFRPLLEREQQILVVSLSQPLPPLNGSRVQTTIKTWWVVSVGLQCDEQKRLRKVGKLMNATHLCMSLGKGVHGTDNHTNTLLENTQDENFTPWNSW